MTREPWKRAAQLSQQKYRPAGGTPSPGPEVLRRPRMRPGCVVGWLVLVMVLAGLITLYFTRGWWIPRYREELPAPVVDVVEDVAPEPQRSVDWVALERGLGANLVPFTDYLQFVGRMGDWQVEPTLINTGGGTLQVRAPGITLYVQHDVVYTYNIDLAEVFADSRLQAWQAELRDANLTPDLTWTALTGETDMPRGATKQTYRSDRSSHLPGGWVYPVYTLHFLDGWLRYIELGVEFGVSDETPAPDSYNPTYPGQD